MGKRKHKTTHHICPRSRINEGYNVHSILNKIRLKDKEHKNFHSLFVNKLPHEQLQYWLDVNRTVLDNQVVNVIEIVLSLQKSRFYQLEVIT